MTSVIRGSDNFDSSQSAVVGDITLSTAGATFTFTGLNFLAGQTYELYTMVQDGGVSGAPYAGLLFVNGDLVGANYYCQTLNANGTSVLAGRSNNPQFISVDNGAQHTSGKHTLFRTPQAFMYEGQTSRRAGATQALDIWSGAYNFAVAGAITQIQLSFQGTLAAGSRAVLRRVA